MKCILCTYEDNIRIIHRFNGYELYHCNNCDLIFWYPLVFLEVQYKYDIRYLQYAFRDIVAPYHHKALEVFQMKCANNKILSLLEIGCGNGSFLNLVRNIISNIDCNGVDLNDRAVQYAKKRFCDINVICGNFFEDSELIKNIYYDIICFFEVLEHQTDLHAFIIRIISLLKPGGLIIGSVPNRERYLPLNKREIVDYPPHHFSWWNIVALRSLFVKYDFEDIEVISCNEWNALQFSLLIETLLLKEVKQFLKEKFINRDVMKHMDDIGSLEIPLPLRVLNNNFTRYIRAILFMPISLPFFVKYIFYHGRPSRSLLFFANKRSQS